MACTREKGHDWRDSDHDKDHCPQHTVEVETQRIANNLHRILNVELGQSCHNSIAWCRAPLYRAVQAATMAAFTLVTSDPDDAKELRSMMLDDSGEGIWYWLPILAERKRDHALDEAEHQAALAADARNEITGEAFSE